MEADECVEGERQESDEGQGVRRVSKTETLKLVEVRTGRDARSELHTVVRWVSVSDKKVATTCTCLPLAHARLQVFKAQLPIY